MQVRRSLEGEMAGPVFQPGTPILPIIELDYEVLCWGVVCHRGGMSGGHYTQGDQGAARFDKNKTECASGPVTAYMASHVSTNWASEGCKAPALSRELVKLVTWVRSYCMNEGGKEQKGNVGMWNEPPRVLTILGMDIWFVIICR